MPRTSRKLAQPTSVMLVNDSAIVVDFGAAAAVGRAVGIDEGRTGGDVDAGTGRGVMGASVGLSEGCTEVVGIFVGAGEGFRVSTSFVTDATVRPATPSEALAAASKELPVSDDSMSLE